MEEVFCDSFESMLTDERVIDKIEALRKQDTSIVRKIADFFRGVARKLAGYENARSSASYGLSFDIEKRFSEFADLFSEAAADAGENFGKARETDYDTNIDIGGDRKQNSTRVRSKATERALNEAFENGEYDPVNNPNGGYYVTYKSMSFWGYDENGNAILRSPMAERIDGKLSEAYLIPKNGKVNWYEATEDLDTESGLPKGLMVKTRVPGKKSDSYLPASEHTNLIEDDWSNLYFLLKRKNEDTGETDTVPARYNPYEHSSDVMLNDQFKGAYKRNNLVTVKMCVPVSEDKGTYRAKYSKDPTGWLDWKSGPVAGEIGKQKDFNRRVFLSRYAAPAEIVPDSVVAQEYKKYLAGTSVTVPDVVVSPSLLRELEKIGVPIERTGTIEKWKEKYSDKLDGKMYSFRGYASDGKGKYQSNFPIGTPKSAKSERILHLIQNVWSKNPIPLAITENGENKTIYAQFDPTYDETGNTMSDATKLMGGNRHGSAKDQRVTLDLADDYYKIASESKQNPDNPEKIEIGKIIATHIGVKKWRYFVNDIYFAEYGSEDYEPYTVTINVKQKGDWNFVYSFNAEKEKSPAPQTLHAAVNTENGANGRFYKSDSTTSPSKSQEKNSLRNRSSVLDNATAEDIETEEEAKALLAYQELAQEIRGLEEESRAADAEAGTITDEDRKQEANEAEYRRMERLDSLYAERRKAENGKVLREMAKRISGEESAEGTAGRTKKARTAEEENRLLRKKLAKAEAQMKKSGKKTLAEGDVLRLAASLIRETQAKGIYASDIYSDISAIADEILNGDANENAEDMALKLADRLISKAVETRDDNADTRKALITYLKGADITLPAANRGDIDPAVRKKNAWWLKASGVPVDEVWGHLNEEFPGLFGENIEVLQALVDEAAKEKGYTERLFHQTENSFTVFETRHNGSGTRDNETPFGIFMKKGENDIGIKGKKQMSLYAKIQNPLKAYNREALVYELKRISPEYQNVKEDINRLDKDYQERFDNAKKTWRQWLEKWREKHPDAERREAYNDPEFESVFSEEERVVDEWQEKAAELDIKAKEIITEALKNKGYDGVILLHDQGSFGRSTDAYIALEPSQVKSADPVTYDDAGNVIPLDERFKSDNRDIRYSTRNRADAYKYDTLVKKDDMQIATLADVAGMSRKDIVSEAKKNALQFGGYDSHGAIYVNVPDIEGHVTVTTEGLRHSLDRRIDELAPVTVSIGEILHNSIRINEMTPKKETATGSYILLGIGKDGDSFYFVRSVVNQFTSELENIDVLYAIDTKKEPAVLNAPRFTAKRLSSSDSFISVADFLQYVNKYFPSVLPEDVLRHFGYTERPDGIFSDSVLFSLRNRSNSETENKAIEIFGVTDDFKEAGYILSNGEMLRFTAKDKPGQREYDHRAIGKAYGKEIDLSKNHGFDMYSSPYLERFVEEGAIRFDAGDYDLAMDAGLQLSGKVPLTANQEQTIRNFIEWRNEQEENYTPDENSLYENPLAVVIEFGGDADYSVDTHKKTLDSWNVPNLRYEGKKIYPVKVISDIRRYYETGEIAEQSELSKFYSLRNRSAVLDNATAEDIETEEEAKALLAYQELAQEIRGLEEESRAADAEAGTITDEDRKQEANEAEYRRMERLDSLYAERRKAENGKVLREMAKRISGEESAEGTAGRTKKALTEKLSRAVETDSNSAEKRKATEFTIDFFEKANFLFTDE